MDDWVSMATTFYEPIDCRMVQLEIDFHNASKQQLFELAEHCARSIDNILSEGCFCQWRFGGRHLSYISLLTKISQCTRDFDFSFEADILSNVVYNSKTFRAYDRFIQQESIGHWIDYSVSSDYFKFFDSCFAKLDNPNKYKDAIIRIFNEPGKYKRSMWRQHDASGYFMSYPYVNNTSMYRGTFRLQIALKCLGSTVTSFSEKLIHIVLRSIGILPSISSRISLSPLSAPSACSPHMVYFGGDISKESIPIEVGCLDNEWYPYYYFCGVEWFNLLSPLQASHLSDQVTLNNKNEQMELAAYPNGSILVKLNKPIESMDVDDLVDVKKYLYKALYPGKSMINLNYLLDKTAYGFLAKPRQEWEYIPIFSDEIEIDNQYVVFSIKK